MKLNKRSILFAAVILLITAMIQCGVYVTDYYRADRDAIVAFQQHQTVTKQVLSDNTIAYVPHDAKQGIIFYPGGKVEVESYLPLMAEFAQRGVLCVLIEMPGNLAVLDMDAAEGIREWFPDVETWYIGGHSLGGSMAASWAAENAGQLEGLVLLAAYSTEDLRETGLRVLSAYGSEDGVLDLENYEEYRGNLPKSVSETVIDGGNHACFGSYGPQDGDGTPRITAEQQMKETAELLVDFFRGRAA